MLTKQQTENEILQTAKQGEYIEEEKLLAVINIRNLDSVHSLDCSCNICKPLRYELSSSSLEVNQKIKLDYFRP